MSNLCSDSGKSSNIENEYVKQDGFDPLEILKLGNSLVLWVKSNVTALFAGNWWCCKVNEMNEHLHGILEI